MIRFIVSGAEEKRDSTISISFILNISQFLIFLNSRIFTPYWPSSAGRSLRFLSADGSGLQNLIYGEPVRFICSEYWKICTALLLPSAWRRLDYFIISKRLEPALHDSSIRTEVYGSDHAPIELLLDDFWAHLHAQFICFSLTHNLLVSQLIFHLFAFHFILLFIFPSISFTPC